MSRRAPRPIVLLAAVAIGTLTLPSTAQSRAVIASDWTKALRKAEHESAAGTLPYRVFDAPSDRKTRRPLVIFLHGAGERGTDNEAQLIHGVREFVRPDHQRQHPCHLVAPQCPKDLWWHDPPVADVLTDLIATWIKSPRVDPDRVYLTGLSMGGYGTWHLLARHPEWFAAAVPICGGGKKVTTTLLASPRMTNLPVWNFHGDADRVVPLQRSMAMLRALRRSGNEPRSTVYPGVGHNSWTQTYADGEVRSWLFRQRRLPPPQPLRPGACIVFFGGSLTAAGTEPGGYIRTVEAALKARTPPRKNPCVGAGIRGHRVPDLQARLDRDVLARKPAVVVIHTGIHDLRRSATAQGTPEADYAAGLRDLVARIRKGGARVILCTPGSFGAQAAKAKGAGADRAHPLTTQLDRYAEVSRRVARETRVQLLDLRRQGLAHLRAHDPGNPKHEDLSRDGVLTRAGHDFVAARMLEALGLR